MSLVLRSLASRTTLVSAPAARTSSPAAAAVSRPRRSQASRPSVRAMSASSGDFTAMVNQKNAENAVMVYSKTYCPYCSEVKSLFQRLGVAAKVIELDDLADGSAVQEALQQITGRRTVPQVFIGGKHVGGCDDTMAALSSGKLKSLLEEAGVQAKL